MAYQAIKEGDALLLVRALGLLYNQAGIYGAHHTVTQGTARSVFAEVEQALKTYGPVEIVAGDNVLLLNGASEAVDAAAAKNLYDRMILHKVAGLLFTPPLSLSDFQAVLALFGMPPAKLAAEGGFEASLKRAKLRSISAVNVTYQRLTGNQRLVEDKGAAAGKGQREKDGKGVARSAGRPAHRGAPGVLDLSAELAGDEQWEFAESLALSGGRALSALPASSPRKRVQALAEMLREAAGLLERHVDEQTAHEIVRDVVGRIRSNLTAVAEESQHEISALASQVAEDSAAVADLEASALSQGRIHMTRGELMKRYAELNQEITQPLTVSSGVIQLLNSGKVGELSDLQLTLLQAASESVERVNQLVAYLTRVAGLPDTFTPDAELIADTYK